MHMTLITKLVAIRSYLFKECKYVLQRHVYDSNCSVKRGHGIWRSCQESGLNVMSGHKWELGRSLIFITIMLSRLRLKSVNGISRTCFSGGKSFLSHDATIYALSTNPGKSAIAIVRISGPLSGDIYQSLTNRKSLPEPRKAVLSALQDRNGSVLDHALALYFKGPKSYTGEDLLELHLHGGQAIIRAVLTAIKELNSPDKRIRYAEAGEFSKRAFQNGQLDLTQIEGIRDLIDAETELQRQAAITSAGGNTKELYDGWRDKIVHNMAMVTALIDFSDDNADVNGDLFETVKSNINGILSEINGHMDQISRSELLFSGIKLNLLGPPNAGKSSLLNIIAKREAAIVSEVPGTTRDILEVGMEIGGFKILIGDTAGLRAMESVTGDHAAIEMEGIKRARERFKGGDLIVTVIPAARSTGVPEGIKDEISMLKDQNKRIIVAVNKIDQLPIDVTLDTIITKYSQAFDLPKDCIFPISCTNHTGVPELINGLTANCKELTYSSNGPPIGASQRIRDLLEQEVIYGLENFVNCDDVVIATAELQHAIEGIGKITGRGVGVEELLGVVFSSFCIGK